jgi:hypothetical protein
MPPRSPAPCDVADWLTQEFIGPFERDVDPKIWSGDRGHYAIPMLVLSFCDAMAGLVNGKANGGTLLTVRFIEDEVSKHAGEREIAERYRSRAIGLWLLYRHGLVHRGEPGRLVVGGKEIRWAIYRRFDRVKVHMRLLTQVWNKMYKLEIDADLLYSHVLATFHDIRNRAASDPELAGLIHAG